MVTIRGKGVSAGIAVGPLFFYHRIQNEIVRRSVADTDAEWQRFKEAQAKAVAQLGKLAEKARTEAGSEAALLFETHQIMAEDLDYEEAIEEGIRGGLNAEAVIADVREQFTQMFANMDDAYMRARAADVKDVSDRIIAILTGAVQSSIDSDGPIILAADDLAPSETVQLDKSKILAFVTEGGSSSSHTAILARTMGIPAIVGAGGLFKSEYAGCETIVDGAAGVAVVEPDTEARARLLQKRGEQQDAKRLLMLLKDRENVTRDGQTIRICCNINSPEDVSAVLENDGGGIGLFRSEYLYLGRDTLPDEEEQFEAYRKILSEMDGREVVIRTLDVGADKRADCLDLPHEANPAMGCRALRFCLSRPDIFRTQLRALYRASAFGKLSILLPMITSVWEIREAKALCESVRTELAGEGTAFSGDVPLGAMIETPAAAIISDRLAKEVDFFSCGTNDLTQYTLACDRQNSNLGRIFDPHHPAVLRLLKLTADNARKNGVRIGICGELGADLQLTETFLALGIDELSVSPDAVLPLRQRVREINVSAVRDRLLAELVSD